jgi:hypothetical protein
MKKLLGKLLCRCGKHKLATLRLDHNTLNGGMPSGALYECERCGEIQEWLAAWDQAFCCAKWPHLLAYLESQPLPELPPHLKAGPLASAIARGLTHEEHKREFYRQNV